MLPSSFTSKKNIKYWNTLSQNELSPILYYLVAQLVKSRLQWWRPRFDPWVGKIPWRRKWLPVPVFLPGKSHGQRSWWATVHGVTKSWTRLSNWHFSFIPKTTTITTGEERRQEWKRNRVTTALPPNYCMTQMITLRPIKCRYLGIWTTFLPCFYCKTLSGVCAGCLISFKITPE